MNIKKSVAIGIIGSVLLMVIGTGEVSAMTLSDVVQQLHIYMNNPATLTASSDTSLAVGATTPTPPPSRVLLQGLTYAQGSPMVVNKTLRVGTKSDTVKALQIFLIAKGYLHSDATGYFGPLTKAALKQFQVEKKVTGGDGTIVGPLTRAAIAAEIQQSLSTGTPQ